jgi:hypothetical protein
MKNIWDLVFDLGLLAMALSVASLIASSVSPSPWVHISGVRMDTDIFTIVTLLGGVVVTVVGRVGALVHSSVRS